MATLKSSSLSTNGTAAEFTLCTFCNNSTSGFEKRLFASTQPKGPFFPVLAELQGKRTQLDALGRAVVCVACFHHLLRQWSSFERRGIPVRKREYNIITDDRVTSYQTRREEEIRKDADLKIKEIQDREEKIRLEAEERFDSYQKRQAEIRREAETRLLEEQRKLSLEKRDTSLRLKEEQQREDELRRQAEERVQEEKEKREYIRQEAERLLREEKLIEARESKTTESAGSQVVTKFRTEVIIQPPVAKTADKAHRQEIDSLSETHDVDMESFTDEREKQARTERRRKMVYDPETGCYRKTREDDEDKENSSQETKKTERVEYRFRLRSDEKPWKSVEANDPASKPDKESEDITVSMEPMKHSSKEVIVHTEQTFMLNGKRRADSKDDDEMKKSGDVMKTRFEEGRKRFEQEPLERKTSGADYEGTRSGRNGSFGDSSKLRALSDESLEEKIKEMEKRRERLLLRGPSGGNTQERGGEEKPVEDQSPMSESPRDDGARSPVDDTRKKQRNRHERNKRRLTAEELSLRKLSGSDEDLLGLQSTADVVTKVQKTEPKKISSEESSVQLVVRPVGFDKQEEEVFVKTEKPVEASVDLMMWEDSPDGPRTEDTSPVKPTPVPAPRQRAADRSEPRQEKLVEIAPRQRAAERSEPRQEKLVEIAPRQRAAERSEPRQERLVEIEAPISVTKKGSVESAPVQTGFILDLDVKTSTMSSTPAIESISTWDNRGRSSSTIDEERRLREKEHEERKRRIEENQRRAAKEHKAKKQGREEVKLRDKDEEDVRGTDRLSMMEKRRSLVDLWESYSETPARVISLEEQEKPAAGNVKVSNSHGKRPVSIDLAQGDYEVRDMEVDEDDNSRSSMVGFDENHKLSEEERRWESAGHFQPGRLQKTLFHSMSETSPTDEQPNAKPRKGSRYDWMKTENSADQEALVPTKLKLDWSTKQAAIEKPSTVQVTESSPEPALWTNNIENGDRKSSSSSSESDSESEDERKPRVDIDEGHKLTEDEKQWESAGHFQPRKLNTALLAGFQQGPSHEDHKAAPKTQGGPYDMLKKMHNTSSKQEMLVPSKLVVTESETDERAVEEIRPVKVVETETEPRASTIYESEDESEEEEELRLWWKFEEQRKQQEQEEMERARLEEQRRREREAMEAEMQEETDLVEDEFEAKIRTKEIRRINPNLFAQFMGKPDIKEQQLSSKEPDKVPEPEYTSIVESFFEERSISLKEDEDEYEQKVRSGQIRKLKLHDNPFLRSTAGEANIVKMRSSEPRLQRNDTLGTRSEVREEQYVQYVESTTVESAPTHVQELEESESSDDEPGSFTQEGSAEYESDSDDGVPEWRKVEERRRQQEQEEIARAREEERRRQEQKAMEEEAEEDADSNDDEFEAKVRTKEIRRINPNLLVQFMNRSDDKDVRTSKDSEREVRARGDQWVMSPEITPNEDRSPEDSHTHDDDDDEFEQKVKSGQVKKLVLGNSIFHQTRSDTETKVAQKRSAAERSPKESNQDSKVVLIQEEVFVQRVENEVVESQPALSYYDGGEDDHYELKIKGKDVKRLNQDQFGFLRREEEEARRKLQEEERRRLEREERELMKKEEERRRRLQAQAQAEEEERMSLEAELRRQEEEERERRMEEERRRVEEAERLRREEEERLLREEEMERFTWEEMRRQKQEAQKKFQLGLFDGDDAVNRKDKEIASVGRLDSNKLMTFQQTQAEETRVKSKPRQKTKEEPKAPNVESETVVMSSVSLIHSSPYDDVMEESQPEELDYEEKRKSVGRLDTSWYLKQQQMQAADNDRRARELEAERMREEQYEISRMKKGEDTPAADTDYSEKRRGKLSVDKLHQFQQESKESPKRSKETQEQLITIKSRDEVESAPLEFEEFNYKEKRTSKSYDDGNVVILGRDDSEEAQRKVRLQREKDEREMLLKEEERRRELEEQRAALEEIDEEVDDKPKNVGRLNLGKFSLFQQQHQESSQVVSRKQAPPKEKSVQEVVTVQYQEEVESTPTPSDSYQRDVYRGGPSMSPEEVEYEQRVKSGKRLDVQKFLNSRTQEATEREQRKRQMAEERMRQEKEELDKLRSEEQRRRMLLEAEMEYREESRGAVDVSGSRQSEDSRRNRSESAKEKSKEDTDSESSRRAKASRTTQDSEVDNDSKRVSVGRLPQDRRSTFEGSRETEVVASQPRKRSEVSRSQGKGDSTSKYVIQRSGSSSSNKLPYVSRDEDINGNVTHEEKESLEGKSSFGRKESVKEIQYEDHVIESSTQEEKPVPKRLDTSMFAAFQKSESQPAVHLRRVKSEKNARPKSVGNVDLGRWQDDSSLQQSSATRKQREKTDRQPRPKSIAF